ncbi:type VII secretion protein EssB [Pseudalkalibacillus decolorationis]|uniref:type VII secretion protein EssB n=1 Tax=Pseudalkalibacillus decolorationis TaxID=163879 RepID=UPI002147409C|nr:type VII secretion protein EssB [Pseudalkalibacillus decolorationis]
MSQNGGSYLEELLEATVHQKDNHITFTFQKEQIKLNEPTEVYFLKEMNPQIDKEIEMVDDELKITHTLPKSYSFWSQLKHLDEKERLMCAYQLVERVNIHSLSRVNILVCPENIVFDQGLTPYFLHYGVKESLPPYEKDAGQLWLETRAAVAAMADPQYTFEQYLKFKETLKLSPLAAKILETKSEQELNELLNEQIHKTREAGSLLVSVSKKKWKMNRYVLLGLILCLLPALIYSIYSIFFIQPKQSSIIHAQEKFLSNEYSEVVTAMQPYEIKDMPKVAQYELALSYIINESLTEDQKENVRNTVTLQSDPSYYEYWIHIGRGNAKEALDIARFLEDRDLILFGLLKYREQVKANDELASDEKQSTLDDIESEIEEYEKEMEAQKEKQEEESKSDSSSEQDPNADQQEKDTAKSPEASDDKKESPADAKKATEKAADSKEQPADTKKE